jgi:hypothetical protein
MPRKTLHEASPALEESAARPSWTSWLVVAVLIPPLVAFAILFHLTLTVPYQDDYDAILAFASDYEQLSGLPTRILAIATAQHNEYKLGFEHSIVALELEVTHHLNFTFLTVLGDLILLPIGCMLWQTYQGAEQTGNASLRRRLLAFLPISLCFFSLTYWENLNWAMTGLQNTPVVLFSLLAIYLVAREQKPTPALLFWGCLSASLAAFTSANGFLLAPLGLLIFLPRRAFAACAAWCAAFVLPLVAYLYHHTASVHPAHRLFYIRRPLFFLGFLGGVVPVVRGAPLAGLVILAVLVLAARSRFDRVNPTAFYFMVWIVATACLVAWVRGSATYSIASRYSMYSSLLLIFCYSFLAHQLVGRASLRKQRLFWATAIVVSAIFCLASDVTAYRRLAARRRMVLSGIELYRASPDRNSPMVDPIVDQTFPLEKNYEHRMLTEAIKEKIYALPSRQGIR